MDDLSDILQKIRPDLRAQLVAEAQAEALRSRPRKSSTLRQYWNDPVAFVHDCIDWRDQRPAPYQEEILSAIPQHKRVSVRGPHGLGKSGLAAWIVLWFALTRDGEDWKVPTTASTWRQLSKYLWPEVQKWARRIKWDKVGREPFRQKIELLDLSLKLNTGEAFALASDKPELLEGAHASNLLYIFDEAKTIPVGTWDAVEGAFSAGECMFLSFSTPGEPSGRFYDIQSSKAGYQDWWTRRVSLEEAVAAGRISRSWANDRKEQWGENSAVYINRVLGDFAATGEDSVIPLTWVEEAVDRWNIWNDAGRPGAQIRVGVDVARYGEDKTTMAPVIKSGEILAVPEIRYSSLEDTMQTTGRVVGILEHGGYAVVDVVGLGAGVVDRLREMQKNVKSFNAAGRSDKTDVSGELGFVNLRSAAWWWMREALSPNSKNPIALPNDPLLIGDLTTPRWKIASLGKIAVESKDEIRKRIGRSTDAADGVIMGLFPLVDEPSDAEMEEWAKSRGVSL